MTAAELSALSDQQLSERVAVEVAGWWKHRRSDGSETACFAIDADSVGETSERDDGLFLAYQVPDFATSADAVLPLLEKYPFISIDRVKGDGWQVAILSVVELPGGGTVEGVIAESWQDTIAKATCVALLLAKGVA